jgi:hypothetical protein
MLEPSTIGSLSISTLLPSSPSVSLSRGDSFVMTSGIAASRPQADRNTCFVLPVSVAGIPGCRSTTSSSALEIDANGKVDSSPRGACKLSQGISQRPIYCPAIRTCEHGSDDSFSFRLLLLVRPDHVLGNRKC